MDEGVDDVKVPISFHHQQQDLLQQPQIAIYDHSSAAGEDDDEDENEEDEDEDEDEENEVKEQITNDQSMDQQQQQQHQGQRQQYLHDEDESSTAATDDEENNNDNENSNHDDEQENDNEEEDENEPVFPPPVIAEISEDSQEYYMKPPEKMDDGPKPFRCDLCDKRFQEKSSVYRHIKEVHRKIIVLMGEDGRIAKVKSSPVHSCCGTTFTTRRALLRHQKSAACSCNMDPALQEERSTSNKRKRVNGMTSNKRNGSGVSRNAAAATATATITATSSEDDRFDDEEEEEDDDDEDNSLDQDFHASAGSTILPLASSAPSLSMGIPYRCPYGVCPQFFTTKDMMTNHLKTAHQMRMELVSISAPGSAAAAVSLTPRSLAAMTTTTGLTSTTILMTDKKFPCAVYGCQAAFTRKDRLNLHVRTRHANNNNSSSSCNNSGSFISGLKVKLPSIHQDYRMIVSASKSSTRGTASHASQSGNGSQLPVTPRQPKETIHPKKHACDYPGCEKSYTKNSHVKRHKLSAHPDLFPQSNGGRVAPVASHQRHVNNSLNNNDEDDEDEDEDAASDDDNFEVFDDQDDEPVVRKGKNVGPRITPTLKSSFLSLTSKSNGNRKRK